MNRENNIELLRIILMFMIVLLHMISHGLELIPNLISEIDNKKLNIHHLGIFNVCVISVNCFVLISGFFGIRLKYANLKRFAIQALSVSLILLMISFALGREISTINIIKSFVPILSNYWWFLSTYILLCVLSPFINLGFDTMNIDDFRKILFILFLMNCVGGFLFNTFNANSGYSILNFLFLYCLGRYLNKSSFDLSFFKSILIYIILTSFTLVIGIYLFQHNPLYFLKFYSYNNPILCLTAVMLFYIFRKIKISANLRWLSSLTFGVYLFSDNDLIRGYLPLIFKSNSEIVFILFVAFAIFCISAILEFFRSKIENLILLKK